MDTYYGCCLITYQKHFTAHDRGLAEGEGEKKDGNRGKKAGIKQEWKMGKRNGKVGPGDWEDEPCICVLNMNRRRRAWGSGGIALRYRWGEQWSGQHPFFVQCLQTHPTREKRGRVLAKGGYKLPVIDARCRAGRQLKTCGAHRWPSFHSLLPFSNSPASPVPDNTQLSVLSVTSPTLSGHTLK